MIIVRGRHPKSDKIQRDKTMSSNLPTELDSQNSILFLGSGFSQGAVNIQNGNLPIGGVLKAILAKDLEVDPNDYDLKTLSDEYASRSNLSLYQKLYHLFTVQKLTTDQKEILKRKWLRIYTTNYDDAAEFSYQEDRISTQSFSYDDEKPKRLASGAIIHLHGTIRKTTEENVLQQLILNESSYVRQHFEKSPWYDDFIRDLRFSSACFFCWVQPY